MNGRPSEKLEALQARSRRLFSDQRIALIPGSLCEGPDILLAFVELEGQTRLLVERRGGAAVRFESERRASEKGAEMSLCPLSHDNAAALRHAVPWTAPSPLGAAAVTIGLGDRLGVAGPGHLRAVRRFAATPVLAQQSPRELTLTGRSFSQVLDAASWAVFREGFRAPWGADGDHVKTEEQVRSALDAGFTMITADVSDFLPVSPPASASPAAVYRDAIQHGARLYRAAARIAGEGRFDFELSVDETGSPTTPEAHQFIAAEAARIGMRITSLAPRFVGEFEKSIDYIGTVPEFEASFAAHVELARQNGYRISVHSGSDKFSVFPSIGRLSGEQFHIKTSGTSWLEALRVIARTDARLFADVYGAALAGYPSASRLYHVTPDLSKLPDPRGLRPGTLSGLLDDPHARRVLHITYGEILGNAALRDALMRGLARSLGAYHEALEKHIVRHLTALGVPAAAAQ